jgi:hypothetical protein
MMAETILYHYTSLEAFIGIVEKGKLWATDVHYLNDTSEQKLFEGLIRSRIAIGMKAASSEKRKKMGKWSEHLSSDVVPYYVVCFSEDGGNRLSQWRGYAAQGGVSVGFNKSKLASFCTQQSTREFQLTLREVRYVNPLGGDVTAGIIDNLLKVDLDALYPGGKAAKAAVTLATYFGLAFKHLAFEEEKETRLLLYQTTRALKHRVRGSLVVPYLELEVGQHFSSLVDEVVVGPSPHKDQTAESITKLLELKGWKSTKVKCSDMPYRGW